jgi:maltooligosyltrehalose trehalohydrolase
VGGDYVEELHGADLNLKGIPALEEVALKIPSHYGRIWTRLAS